MSILHQHPISLTLSVVSGLLALWLAGGLLTVLVVAAFADLALSMLEKRQRRTAPVGITRKG